MHPWITKIHLSFAQIILNLKHKILDLIDQEVVSLQQATPNVNTNPLPNNECTNISIIETDDDLCGTKW